MSFSFQGRVYFSDTDSAGFAHFTSLLKYVENAEHSLFREKKIPSLAEGIFWLRAQIECRYLAPLQFSEKFSVSLFAFEKKTHFLSYKFSITEEEQEIGIAKGKIQIACLDEKGKANPSLLEKISF